MFNVGDKVRVLEPHVYDRGHIGFVTEVDRIDGLFRVGPDDKYNWHADSDVELVTDEPREATVSIDVDTTQLREAVELAQRLADAMERIKAVFK